MTDVVDETNSGGLSTPANVSHEAALTPPRTVDQEVVNRLVVESKEKGYQKGYKTALAELEKQQGAQASYNSSSGGNPTDDVKQIVANELKKYQQEAEQQALEAHQKAQREEEAQLQAQLKTQLFEKAKQASHKYEDYNDVLSAMPNDFVESMPEVAALANSFDNGGEILYELFNNPSKIAVIRGLYQGDKTARLAYAEMKKLSDSISKREKDVENFKEAPAPLDQLRPSTIDTGSGSPSSLDQLRALKKKYRG